MSVLSVRTFPDPFLKQPTQPVGRISPQVLRLLQDLIETMRSRPRCVGLAAPQVGSHARVAVVDVRGHPKASASHGLIVLVDPRIMRQEGSSIQREGCLSIPDLTANIHRAVRVKVEARDPEGQLWTRWFEGFEAIAMQHEIDHLDGKLFLDRVANLKADVFRRKTYR